MHPRVMPETDSSLPQACRQRAQARYLWARAAFLVVFAFSGCNHPFATDAPPAAPAEKASPTIRYLAHSRLFVPNLRVGALAALPDRLLATTVGPGQEKLVAIDAAGRVLPLGVDLAAPPEAVCQLALSPGHHPGFPEGDVLLSVGPQICRVHLDTGAVVPLASLAPDDGDVSGLCFDPVGRFDYSLLVLAGSGGVYRLDAASTLQRIGCVGPGGQGPSIASALFGPYAGQLLVAFPASGDVLALSPVGQIRRVAGWSGVTGAYAVPAAPLALTGSAGAVFIAVRAGDTGRIYQCTREEAARHSGALLLTSLHASGNGLLSLLYGTMTISSWSRYVGTEVAATFVQRPAVARAQVDVRPGGPDEVSLGSIEPVAVAVLSSPVLTPSNIDASTVTLAGASALPPRRGTPGTDADLNGDGTLDLVLDFRPADMDLTAGRMTLVLEGMTFEGHRLHGEARVQVLP